MSNHQCICLHNEGPSAALDGARMEKESKLSGDATSKAKYNTLTA